MNPGFYVLNAFFPNICPVCEKNMTEPFYHLCASCRSHATDKFHLKTVNADDLSDLEFVDKRKFFFDKLLYLSEYHSFEKSFFQMAKFKKNVNIRNLLLNYLLTHLRPFTEHIQWIIPAPSSHDLIRYMAHNIGKKNSISVSEAFMKIGKKESKTMDQNTRYRHINNHIAINLNSPLTLTSPKKILLLDDIWTTGATMNHLSKLLVENGVKKEDIWCFVLFIKMKNK